MMLILSTYLTLNHSTENFRYLDEWTCTLHCLISKTMITYIASSTWNHTEHRCFRNIQGYPIVKYNDLKDCLT